MQLIQEILGLLEKKEAVKTLISNRDWFEFGRFQSSTVSGSSYFPRMTPHVIRYDDLVASIVSNIPVSSITLTTTGTSGPATLTGTVLNIPQYQNTTYTAGTGLTLTGTVFSLTNVSTQITNQSAVLGNGGTFGCIEGLTVNSTGQLTAYNYRLYTIPTIVAGSGITVTPNSTPTTSTITISATGGSSTNAWYNIAVANNSTTGGSNTLVPDAVQDTLTFAGGTGIEVSTLDTGGTLDRVVIRNTGVTSFAGATGAISIGSGLSFSGGTLTATGGSGTVTSVGLTMPTGFNVSGSPITTSGAFNVTLALSNGVVGVCNGELSILNLSGLTFNNSTCTLTADPAPIQSIIAGTGITVTPGPNVTVSSSVVSCLDNKYDTYNMVIAKGNDPTIVSLTGVALGFKATVANLEYNLVLTLSYQGINDGSGSFPAETNASIPVRFMKSTTSGTLLPPSFGNFTELVKWDDYFLVPAADSARSATRTYSWTVKNLPLNEAVSIWVGGSPAYAGTGAISVTKANLSITVAACEAYRTNIGTITTQ